MLGEPVQVVELVEMGIHLIPVHAEILVGEHVPKSGQRRQSFGKLWREHSKTALPTDRLVVILRLRSVFKPDDAAANVDAALRGDFEVSLSDVPEVRILLEITPRLFLKWA